MDHEQKKTGIFFGIISGLGGAFGIWAIAALFTGLSSVNFQVANRMFNDNSLLQNQLDRILYLFYFLSMGFLLFYAESRLGLIPYALEGIWLFLFNLAFCGSVDVYSV